MEQAQPTEGNHVAGAGGVWGMTIQVKRAATGLTETFHLVGREAPAETQLQLKEALNGSSSLHDGA